MDKSKIKRLILVVPFFLILIFYYIVSTQDKMKQIREEAKAGTMEKGIHLHLTIVDEEENIRRFKLGEPLPVSREVFFVPEKLSTNCFHLPKISQKTVEFEDTFVGDVKRGGSCNVDILSYVPHGLTHIETSAHILNRDTNPPTVKDIPAQTMSGIVYLIDLSYLGTKQGQIIPKEEVEKKLAQNTLPISMLAIKTCASLLAWDYDFSGKDFLALAPEAAKAIHDYPINCLILDLPSIDPEKDDGKLLAHRNFFGLPPTGSRGTDNKKRVLVELAWFTGLKEGYYYAEITPPRLQTHAVSTGITFKPMIEIED